MFSTRLIAPVALMVIIGLCILAFANNSLTLLVLLGIMPFIFLMAGKPYFLAMAGFLFFFSSVRLFGLPGQRQIHEFFMCMFFAVYVARTLLLKKSICRSWSQKWTFIFLMVLFVIMYVRGFGFQALGGGDKWGGGRYLSIIPCAFFFLSSDMIKFTGVQWSRGLIGMILLALLPAVAELTFRVSGQELFWQFFLITPTGTIASSYAENTLRFSGFFGASMIYIIPFILFPAGWKSFFKYLPFIVVGFLFAGLAGYRLGFVRIILFMWVFFLLKARKKVTYIIASMALLAIGCFILARLAQYLPVNFQRMLSIIPFAKVPYEVYMDAHATSVWRIMLWKEALHEIPKYLWIGKGFAYDAYNYVSAMKAAPYSEYQNLLWALDSSSYHQGILSLLIGMGLPGLLAGMGFMVSVTYNHLKMLKTKMQNETIKRIHVSFAVLFCVSVVSYLFVYGDVFASFPSLFVYAAVLEAIKNQHEEELRKQELPDGSGQAV